MSASADVIYLADTKNAPYGTKAREELICLAEQSITRLIDCGCEHVLIACCTASTVYDALNAQARAISTPIIAPAAFSAARVTKNGKIGVIATESTVRSGEFEKQIKQALPVCRVTSVAAQSLVSMVEGGGRDGSLTAAQRETLRGILSPLIGQNIDTLILGCTHFSHLENEIRAYARDVRLVLPSREGVAEMIRRFGTEILAGGGTTVYINT